MDNILIDVGYIISCYLLGWFMTGYFVVHFLARKDIRTEGSGNIGAMNSGRAAGAKGFILTFLGDFIKGVLAVGLGVLLQLPGEVLLLGLTSVVAGHIWPVPFDFKGGKGISTFAGGLAVYSPLGLLILLILAAVFYLLLKEFTPAGLIALVFWPVIGFVLEKDLIDIERSILNPETSICSLLINLVLILTILYAHRKNIKDYAERHFMRR